MTYIGRRRLFLFLLGSPAVIYVLAVAVWPLAQGIYFSLFDYSLLHPASRSFLGLGNYVTLFTDPSARQSVVTTLIFTLCAVAPDGRRHAFMYHHGPSGHALGAGFAHRLEPDQAEPLAAAWEHALRKAPTVDFQVQVGSDFGRYWLVVRDGKARSTKKREPAPPPLPPLETDDLGALEAALGDALSDRRYLNFLDGEARRAALADAVDDEGLATIRRVKAELDPADVVRFGVA